MPGPKNKNTHTHSWILQTYQSVEWKFTFILKNTCPMICLDKKKQGSWNTWKPFDSEWGCGYQFPWLRVILRHVFLAIETWQCLIFTVVALRKRYHHRHHMPWQGGSNSFSPFSSWHFDFQVPHISCLDAKNRFPQGWAKAGDNAFCKYQRMLVLWYLISSKRR